MRMKFLHRLWWRMTMDLRPMFSFLAERFPKLAPWAVFARAVTHAIVGNPIQCLLALCVVLGWVLGMSFFALSIPALVAVGTLEVSHRVLFESGRGGRWVGWREAWRLHRRLPFEWARGAAKTRAVQAEVGTSKEPVASARLRPVADHPKMGWWPTINWPQVSWWVGPPPGRSFDKFAEVLDVLAANYSRCVGMDLEYDRSTDSYARLIVSFGSILNNTIDPVDTEVDAVPWQPLATIDPDTAVDSYVPWEPTIVDGDAA